MTYKLIMRGPLNRGHLQIPMNRCVTFCIIDWALLLKGQKGGGQSGQSRVRSFSPVLSPHVVCDRSESNLVQHCWPYSRRGLGEWEGGSGRAHACSTAILYYTILYYTMLYYTILCYTILYYTILYYSMLL